MTATGYIGGDPTKVDVDGWTLGDVLAADPTGTLVAIPLGSATEVLTVTPAALTDLDYAAAGGGGAVTSVFGRAGAVVAVAGDYAVADITGLVAALAAKATIPAVRLSKITTGNVTFPNSAPSWAINTTLNAPAIPAAVGDYIEVSLTALFDFASDSFLDVGVITGAGPTIVRYLGSGSGTPLVEGNPGLYPDPAFNREFGTQGFVVTAPDLDAGTVRLALVSLATGSGQALASAAFPFAWCVKNLGPVT